MSCILGMMMGLCMLVRGEEASPTSTLETDMERMISLETLEESSSDDPDVMDFLHGGADPFRTLSRRLWNISSTSVCRESGEDLV